MPISISATTLAPPARNAYGIWVRTWSTGSQPEASDDSTVVSEIGETWSPQTAPASTVDTAA